MQSIKRRIPIKNGESHGMHKLTSDQVREIRIQIKSGRQRKFIMNDFNVSGSQYNRIKNNKAWMHLT